MGLRFASRQPDRSVISEKWMLKRVQHDDSGYRAATPHRHPELVSGSISPLARSHRLKAETHGQIPPFGVLGIDQVELPLPVPALELLLAGDGAVHVAECIEMDEPGDAVAGGEAGDGAGAVFPQAFHQVGCHSDIERAVMAAGEDVDARDALELHDAGSADGWTLKQVQGDEIARDRMGFLQ